MTDRETCLGGCGFFGNPDTAGMCSKCFRELAGIAPLKKAPPSGENRKSNLLWELKTADGVSIQVRHGDMTEENVDCIVNAANASLDHASGLAGAIIKKGGEVIQRDSDIWISKNGRLEEGMVMHTIAGKLPCKFVLHAVGPMWHGGNAGEEVLLGMTVVSCLTLAEELKCTSISLPAISSGIFGFPKERCATIMFELVQTYLRDNKGRTAIKEIRFTNFDDRTVEIFEKEASKLGAQKCY